MIIYFYLFILLLFVPTDSSSIRGRNNKNDLVPFMSSRSVSEKRDIGKETVSNQPFFMQLRVPNSGDFESRRKDKKKKPMKKRISKLKSLRKRPRTRRELQIPKLKSIRGEHLNSQEISQAVNTTEKLQNITNEIRKVDILKALSDYSKKLESKRSKTADSNFKDYKKRDAETAKHASSTRTHNNHHLSEPLLKMVYPSTPKPDRHSHKYTHRDLITDRERLEQKIKYIKSMLNVNDSVVDDGVRVRRRSDSDRTANRIAKMFLTLSAVNGLHDRRKPKCEEDDEDNRVQDVWEKERKDTSSRKSSSSNEQRYKVKKWIEFMKNKRSSGKTCPCMALNGEERDVFPLEQTLPKDYLLVERRDSSEESSETYKDPFYSSRDKPIRDSFTKRRLNRNQEDQDSKLKGLPKSGKKKPDVNFTDLELYRSRAKQILRNAEEILDRIKEEEEKRISAPNLFMSRLKELTSAIQGDPRNNENDLIRKLQKNLGWGPLAKSEEGNGGNQFLENVKSFILDPYEKAKALTDESTRKLSSYLLQNLGKIQEPSEEETQALDVEDEAGQPSLQAYFGHMLSNDEKPLPDSLTKEHSVVDPKDTEKSYTNQEGPYKQRVDDIIQQQIKLNEHEAMDPDGSGTETDRVDDKATETVRENLNPNLEDKVSVQLKDYDAERISEARETATKDTDEVGVGKATKDTDEVGVGKATKDNDEVEMGKATKDTDEVGVGKATKDTDEVGMGKAPAGKLFLHPEGTTQEEKGDNKGPTSGDMQTEEKLKEEIFEEIIKTINTDTGPMTGDREKIEKIRNDDDEDRNSQTGEELPQSKHNSEGQNEQEEVQEVVASSQKTSGEISERDENDVVSSPHSAEDYEFLSERENQDFRSADSYYDPSSPEEGTPTGSDPYVKAVEEDPDQIKTNDEIILENQGNVEAENTEPQSSLNLSNLDSKETVGVEEQVAEKKPVEGKEVSEDEKQDEEMIEVNYSAKEPLESADLVKASQASNESSGTEEISEAYQKSKSNEDMEETAKDEDTLKMEHSDIENSRSTGKEIDEGNTDGETFLKLSSNIQDSEDGEGKDNQEDSSDTTLRLSLDENSQDSEPLGKTQDNQNQQSIESEDETPLRAENFQTPKEESSNDTLLKDTLDDSTRDEKEDHDANLRAEKPTIETENQELTKNGDEVSEEAFLKEAKEAENSEEIQLSAATIDHDDDDFRKASLEFNSNEERTNEGNDTPLKAIQNEDLEEELKTQNVESTSQEGKDDTENLRESSDTKVTKVVKDESSEEALKSENVGEDKRYEVNEEKKESAQEITDTIIPEESDENLKLQKPVSYEDDSIETTAGLKEDQENLEEGTILKESDPRENVDHQTENEAVNNEDTLRSQNPHLKNEDQNENASQEIQASRNQESLETDDEKELQQANPREKSEEEQNSTKATQSALEDKTEENLEVESGETIKAANPDDGNQNTEEQNVDDDGESVKSVFEDEEPEKDEETVKAVMESETQDNPQDIEALREESSLEKVEEKPSKEDERDESVRAVLADESQEELGENVEAVKAANAEEISESEDVLEALENAENVDDDETVQEKAKSNEKLEEDEEVMDNVKASLEDELERTATQTERDETPLRAALSQENLEEKYETLKAEHPIDEEESDSEESLRSAILEEMDNKIEGESPLRSANPGFGMDEDLYPSRSASEKTLRESSNNEVDGDKDERVKLQNFDMRQSGRDPDGHGSETLMEDLLRGYASEDNYSPLRDATSGQVLEENGSQLSDLLQIPDPTSKSIKGSTLKVPKSIGQIMSDLEGKTKDEITSIQNLDPDKIDHIIDKIGEAEQNLLENHEVDCRKECACAEEMSTRSRNIGRYEIAKDILHWLKDLQLNRVLSDD